MPRDLLAEAGIKVDQPISYEEPKRAPRDLLAEANINPAKFYTTNSSSPFLTGLKKGVKNVGYQAEQNFDRLFDAMSGLNIAGTRQPGIDELSKNPEYVNALQKSPKMTKFGGIVGESLPYAALPLSRTFAAAPWLSKALGMGAVGGATSENPALGATTAAIAEPAGAIVTKLAGKMLNYVNPFLQGKAKKLWDSARGRFGQRGSQAEIEEYEDAVHTRAREEAAKYNQNFDVDIDNSRYVNALRQKRDEIINEQLPHTNSPELRGAVQLLNQWINAPHQELSGMLRHNKVLNRLYGKDIKPGVPIPDWLPSFAIKNIKETMQENLEKNGLTGTLGKYIDEANTATKERVKYHMFKNAKNEKDIVNIYNKLDESTQENLFPNKEERDLFKKFDDMFNGKGKIYHPLPPTSEKMAYTQRILKEMLQRGVSGSVVAPTNQGISFEDLKK